MYNDKNRVFELSALIEEKEAEIKELTAMRQAEIEKIPEGYELLNPGDIVPEKSICWGSDTNCWYTAGNSVGKTLNENGYVTGITLKGYKYAKLANQ